MKLVSKSTKTILVFTENDDIFGLYYSMLKFKALHVLLKHYQIIFYVQKLYAHCKTFTVIFTVTCWQLGLPVTYCNFTVMMELL